MYINPEKIKKVIEWFLAKHSILPKLNYHQTQAENYEVNYI